MRKIVGLHCDQPYADLASGEFFERCARRTNGEVTGGATLPSADGTKRRVHITHQGPRVTAIRSPWNADPSEILTGEQTACAACKMHARNAKAFAKCANEVDKSTRQLASHRVLGILRQIDATRTLPALH